MRNRFALAVLALAALGEPALAQGAPTQQSPAPPSSFYATKLQVGDMDANVRFYMNFLGMKKVPNDTPGHDNVVMLSLAGGATPNPAEGPMLILNSTPAAPQVGTAYGALVFMIADVDAIVSRMKAAGTKILQEPKHNGAFAVSYVADPDGRPVELLQIGGR